MVKIKKVNTIEVKRCFAISQVIRYSRYKKSHLPAISKDEFLSELSIAKAKVLKLSEKELDYLVKGKYKKRLIAYDNSDWYLGELEIEEAGVWRRAGDLPLHFTNNNLKITAEKVKSAIDGNSKLLSKRPKIAIPNILNTNIALLQKEKYLLPIAFVSGTGTNGRRRLKVKTKFDLDDGCIRSISLAISGKTKIKAYIGFPKKIQK